MRISLRFEMHISSLMILVNSKCRLGTNQFYARLVPRGVERKAEAERERNGSGGIRGIRDQRYCLSYYVVVVRYLICYILDTIYLRNILFLPTLLI